MAQRFCHRCDADVEDTGGFCLLGHRLAVAGPDEVHMAPPPPPPPPPADPGVLASVSAEPELPVSSTAPTWAQLDLTPGVPPVANDPINDFAPPPRMDWGPRDGVKRFSLKRLRAEVSV